MNQIKIRRKWNKRLNPAIFFILMAVTIIIGCSSEKPKEAKIVDPCEIINEIPTQDIKKAVKVNYGNKVRLLGITANKISQDKLEIKYYWQLNGALGKENNVFVHINDPLGKALFQNDHAFCPQARVGQFVKETYVIDIPQIALGKEVSICMGFFSRDPWVFLDIISAEGALTDKSYMGALVEKIKL
jgi:hypothetical protein